jgi:hypothetical protein
MRKLTRESQVRAAFWRDNPNMERRRGRCHNDQPTDTRCAFCDWVDYMVKSGRISASLAHRVTL